jgi:hypothetical protein
MAGRRACAQASGGGNMHLIHQPRCESPSREFLNGIFYASSAAGRRPILKWAKFNEISKK